MEHAASELLKVGAECEVLTARELRERMRKDVAALSTLYARS
jgi:predicted DNA-binding transcriptional regulator YafY